ncbi:MAG: response regulator transcription factor [Pseudomonadota bacterium]|nr:response regulator transcription factor [Pseudomonadota bacterium]
MAWRGGGADRGAGHRRAALLEAPAFPGALHSAHLRERTLATILLIDDDAALLDLVALACEEAGHTVILAADGRAGLARVGDADVVVSDVNLPGLDGFTLCRRVRETHPDLPLVLLTARDSEIDEALGLELGADDYVTKPFSTRVLLARVHALLRRRTAPPSTRRVGDLEIDVERLTVRWRGALLATTLTEFRLMDAMTRRPDVVRSRAWLLDEARGDDSVVAERLVDTYVRRLRRAFEAADTTFDRIETIVGAGYRWRG